MYPNSSTVVAVVLLLSVGAATAAPSYTASEAIAGGAIADSPTEAASTPRRDGHPRLGGFPRRDGHPRLGGQPRRGGHPRLGPADVTGEARPAGDVSAVMAKQPHRHSAAPTDQPAAIGSVAENPADAAVDR